VPDDDLVLDDFRNVDLDNLERLRLPFSKRFEPKVSPRVRGTQGPLKKAKQLIMFDGPTGGEMRRRNTGCGCTVVRYGHRWNNIAIQHGVTPEIAYRDAAGNNTHENLEHLKPQSYDMWGVGVETYATMDVLPPGPTPMTVQAIASI
jgi:hypothetical protein